MVMVRLFFLMMLVTQAAAPVPPASFKNSGTGTKTHHTHQRKMQTQPSSAPLVCSSNADCTTPGQSCHDFSTRRRASISPGRRLFGAPSGSSPSGSSKFCVPPTCSQTQLDNVMTAFSASCSSMFQSLISGSQSGRRLSEGMDAVCACLQELPDKSGLEECRPDNQSMLSWHGMWDMCQSMPTSG